MAEPMRPAIRMDIITGASSLHMELPTTEPISVAKPRSASNGPVCNAITPPMNNERMQAISKLALPISNNWSYTFRQRELANRSEEHTSELQSLAYLVCRLLLEKKKNKMIIEHTVIKRDR